MRKKHSKQEKAKIVLELLREEKTLNQIASEYGVHPSQLSQWKKTALEGLPDLFERKERELRKIEKEHQKKVDHLYKKIGDLTIQVDWLKKNLKKLCSNAERKDLIEKEHPTLSVVKQAQLLDINRSSIYYKPVGTPPEELTIKHRIDEIYTKHSYYGSRRITATLNREGFNINRKAVQRHMREMGISGVCPGPNLSRRNHQHSIYPYLLRNVPITHPNHVWGIDITYIRLAGGWMYLVAIIDWYSRFIVSWELSSTLDIDFVLQAQKQALTRANAEIANSDQGSHFTSPRYTELFKKAGIKISMNGKGRALDNIYTERFFRSLKWEKVYLKEYENPRHARTEIAKYINFYNNERPHQELQYHTPAEVYTGSMASVA